MFTVKVTNVCSALVDFPVKIAAGQMEKLQINEAAHLLSAPAVECGEWVITLDMEDLRQQLFESWTADLGYYVDYKDQNGNVRRAETADEFPWELVIDDGLPNFLQQFSAPERRILHICAQIDASILQRNKLHCRLGSRIEAPL